MHFSRKLSGAKFPGISRKTLRKGRDVQKIRALQRDNNCAGASAILRARTEPVLPRTRTRPGTRVSAARELHRAWVHVEASVWPQSTATLRERRIVVARSSFSPARESIFRRSAFIPPPSSIISPKVLSKCVWVRANRTGCVAARRGCITPPPLSFFLSLFLSKCELLCTSEFEKPHRRTLNFRAELEAASKVTFNIVSTLYVEYALILIYLFGSFSSKAVSFNN